MVLGLGFLPFLLMPPTKAPLAAPPCPLEKPGADLAREAGRLLAMSRYADAERLLLCAVAKAQGEGDRTRLAKILNNLGAARLYQQDFSGAMKAFREALALAQQMGQAEVEASVWSNLATLYGMLRSWPAAEEALGQALAVMPAASRFRTALLAQRVRLARGQVGAETGRFFQLWRDAMNEAERLGDWQVQRHLWDELSEFHLETGRTGEAESALANSFRIVRLHRLTDPDSLWFLTARLRLEQGRAREALMWLGKVRASWAGHRNPVNALRLAVVEGRAVAAERGAAAALTTCRRNWPRVLEWRRAVLPDPQVELASDVAMTELAELYAAAALTGLGAEQGSAEAWAVVEQSRALGVLRQRRRAVAARNGTSGAEVGPMILPTAHLRNGGVEANPEDSLDEAGQPGSRRLLRLLQGRLSERQALFCFWLGRERSLLWTVTRDGFGMTELPPREVLLGWFRELRQSILAAGDGGPPALWLFEQTFGRAPEEARRREEWLISADDEPLRAPMAALQVPGEGRRHLGDVRALTFVPSALWLLERGGGTAPRFLVAVGGLVHNSADPRWGAEARTPGADNAALPPVEAELPSLPGSGREVQAIRSLWQKRGLMARLLQGYDATEVAVAQAVADGATDLHFATHVQPAPQPRVYAIRPGADPDRPELIRFPTGEPFLALSLERDGRRAGLGARDLYRLPLDGARVVLNGCSTGDGPAQRGAGLWSYATAWLAAGASSVVASLWPVDDDGVFFEAYYEALLEGRRPGAALHAAQTAMIARGGWRAKPRYWAAYIHLGKD
ncbi:MAG: CHAT domain-containing protein [Bryobacteraceae bacterium]